MKEINIENQEIDDGETKLTDNQIVVQQNDVNKENVSCDEDDKLKIVEELDAETLKRLKEIDEIVEEWKRPATSNLLNLIKFKNDNEKMLFDRLPLSDYDKEQMLIDIYDK